MLPNTVFLITLLHQKTYQSLFGLDEWPIVTVHLVVEAACVAEVVTSAISAPERGGCCATVDTFASL